MDEAGEPDQIAIRCTIMRGGTSKGVYLLEQDIPGAGLMRDRLLKRLMGTPDILQIDGLGGSRLITSKIAIVGRSAHADADIDYTYAQVVPDRDLVIYTSNCGNISAGVGPFAIDAGLVTATAPITTVRIRNTNTGRLLIARVPVAGGRAKVVGSFAIDGVPGTGAEIQIDYAHTVGGKTGHMLPTGAPVDTILLEDGSAVGVTVCDVANPCVFVHAADAGLEGGELPDAFAGNAALLDRLREIRGKAAVLAGLCTNWRCVNEQSPALPLMVLVSPPKVCRTMRDTLVAAEAMDLQARLVWYDRCHESMAGTGSMCTAAASRIEGSVVRQAMAPCAAKTSRLRIGHPMGVMTVTVEARPANASRGVAFSTLAFSRTARRIMDGFVYVPRETLTPGANLQRSL